MQDYGSMKTQEVDFWEETSPSNVSFVCPNWTVNKFLDYTIQNADSGADYRLETGILFVSNIERWI